MDLLLHRLGWSVQVPARRAAERDEERIAAWREEPWPEIKGPRRTWTPGESSKTSPARGEAAEGAHLGPPRPHAGGAGDRGPQPAAVAGRAAGHQARAAAWADLSHPSWPSPPPRRTQGPDRGRLRPAARRRAPAAGRAHRAGLGQPEHPR